MTLSWEEGRLAGQKQDLPVPVHVHVVVVYVLCVRVCVSVRGGSCEGSAGFDRIGTWHIACTT